LSGPGGANANIPTNAEAASVAGGGAMDTCVRTEDAYEETDCWDESFLTGGQSSHGVIIETLTEDSPVAGGVIEDSSGPLLTSNDGDNIGGDRIQCKGTCVEQEINVEETVVTPAPLTLLECVRKHLRGASPDNVAVKELRERIRQDAFTSLLRIENTNEW